MTPAWPWTSTDACWSTEPCARSPTPDVYGIGDAAAAHTRDGHLLRMGCGPGGLAAACAFHAITARMAGRDPAPLRASNDAL